MNFETSKSPEWCTQIASLLVSLVTYITLLIDCSFEDVIDEIISSYYLGYHFTSV